MGSHQTGIIEIVRRHRSIVRIIAMGDAIREREQIKEITLVETISDEALEAAAGGGRFRGPQETRFYWSGLGRVPGSGPHRSPPSPWCIARPASWAHPHPRTPTQ